MITGLRKTAAALVALIGDYVGVTGDLDYTRYFGDRRLTAETVTTLVNN